MSCSFQLASGVLPQATAWAAAHSLVDLRKECEWFLGPPPERDGRLPVEPAEVVVGGTCALRGDHAGTDRRFGGAGGPEDLALPRLDDALQDFATLARLGVGDADTGHVVLELGVVDRKLGPELQGALGNEA